MTCNTGAVEVADVQSLAVLPVGSRVVPFGYGDDAVTIKQHSGTFTSARGCCPPRLMGLPARLLPGVVEVPAPCDVFGGETT